MTASADLLLHTWFSPAFPIGAYTYSHGLEWAIEEGSIATRNDLIEWLRDSLYHGAGRNDGIFLSATIRAFPDAAALCNIAELSFAFQPSRERAFEALAQGRAFIEAGKKTFGSKPLQGVLDRLSQQGFDEEKLALPVAAGLLCASHNIEAEKAVPLYVQAFVANLISAAVRAVPLGQTDGLHCLKALGSDILATADLALSSKLDDVGGMVFRSDIASMKHETQYTRLFRS